MSTQRNPTQQRLINAALELFAKQGVTETTTKQIAELADVNEVTLFRHFGNKHGLLLAAIEEAGVFSRLSEILVQEVHKSQSLPQSLQDYAQTCLDLLSQMPEAVRSVVGEASKYPPENRQALGLGFSRANQDVAEYFQGIIQQEGWEVHFPPEKLASLLNSLLLGYAIFDLTTEFHQLWQNRADFLDSLVTLFLRGAVSGGSSLPQKTPINTKISDLPAKIVHEILQAAKKKGLQEYALVYLLFAAGITPAEIITLGRSHYISDKEQQIIQITQGLSRQVPINQWILGKRYGTYQKNPLTLWLRGRKDTNTSLFTSFVEPQQPLTESEILSLWEELTKNLTAPSGKPLFIEQAQQTWCVDMLMRGVSLDNMQILTGWQASQLIPYAQRAREKTALEQATQLDRRI